MTDSKWMFGATSQVDLANPQQEKRTFFNRNLPDAYSEGGLQIGDNNENDGNARRQNALSYKAQLDIDAANKAFSNDGLPNAKRRTAYDFTHPSLADGDHPLGRSSMKSLGAPSDFVPPVGVQKRAELDANRYDIITTLAKATDPANTPRQRMKQELMVGIPINGKDDGILEIGTTAEAEKSAKKEKQRAYMAQLNADQAKFGGSAPNSARSGMSRDMSSTRVELTGTTGYQIGAGMSKDMSSSMKDIAFDAKRKAQAAYRAALANQQADNAFHKTLARQRDAQVSNDGTLPYMQ